MGFRRSAGVALALTAGVAGALVVSALPAQAHPGDRGGNGGGGGGFAVGCAFSHSGSADPIVMPGMAGMSHLHEFFGNTTTDENSTGASLLAGSTTCDDGRDLSAYWVPALFQDGVRVAPVGARVRYEGRGAGVTAFPAGFMAVSGRTDQSAAWGCAAPGQRAVMGSAVASVPTCDAGSRLVAQVTFPQCWDGTSLDSANHASHLVFATQGAGQGLSCPADHAVRVPQVVVEVRYPEAATGGAGVRLSSGAASTLHADIFEAWTGTSLQDRLTGRGRGQRPAQGAQGQGTQAQADPAAGTQGGTQAQAGAPAAGQQGQQGQLGGRGGRGGRGGQNQAAPAPAAPAAGAAA